MDDFKRHCIEVPFRTDLAMAYMTLLRRVIMNDVVTYGFRFDFDDPLSDRMTIAFDEDGTKRMSEEAREKLRCQLEELPFPLEEATYVIRSIGAVSEPKETRETKGSVSVAASITKRSESGPGSSSHAPESPVAYVTIPVGASFVLECRTRVQRSIHVVQNGTDAPDEVLMHSVAMLRLRPLWRATAFRLHERNDGESDKIITASMFQEVDLTVGGATAVPDSTQRCLFEDPGIVLATLPGKKPETVIGAPRGRVVDMYAIACPGTPLRDGVPFETYVAAFDPEPSEGANPTFKVWSLRKKVDPASAVQTAHKIVGDVIAAMHERLVPNKRGETPWYVEIDHGSGDARVPLVWREDYVRFVREANRAVADRALLFYREHPDADTCYFVPTWTGPGPQKWTPKLALDQLEEAVAATLTALRSKDHLAFFADPNARPDALSEERKRELDAEFLAALEKP